MPQPEIWVADAALPREGPPGLILGNKLGQGSFGTVYKCRRVASRHVVRDSRGADPSAKGDGSKKEYAVKVVQRAGTQLAEVEREVEALQVLEHPSTQKIFDVMYTEDAVYVVLELYKGGDMMHGMMRHWNSKGQIPMAGGRHLTQQMWQAVAFLHSNAFCHCGLKADSFMMKMPEVENLTNRIYLGDVGTAVVLKSGERLSQPRGSNTYWSPEVYRQSYASKADCWAVGVIMFGMFSQNFPFNNEDEVNHTTPKMHSRVCEEGEQMDDSKHKPCRAKALER